MFRRKKKDKRQDVVREEPKTSAELLSGRLSQIGNYTHDYDESERQEVEARIRRMFYGAKVEGSLGERTSQADEDDEDDEPEADAFGRIASA